MTPEQRELASCWHVPSIVHFVWMFQKPLNTGPITPQRLERALARPRDDDVFQALMSRVVTLDGDVRASLPSGVGYGYESVHTMMCKAVECLYMEQGLHALTAANHAGNTPLYTPSIDLEPDNPLASAAFEQLALVTRAALCNLLCNNLLRRDPVMVAHLRQLNPCDCRVEAFGSDARGSRYLFFSNDDCRVYRHQAPDRFELVSSSSAGLKAFMQTLNKKLQCERELFEQMKLLLPDLLELEKKARALQCKSAKQQKRKEEAASPAPVKRSKRLRSKEESRMLEKEKAAAEANRVSLHKAQQRALQMQEMAELALTSLQRWYDELIADADELCGSDDDAVAEAVVGGGGGRVPT